MTPRTVLERALVYLRDPARWSQGASARDARGRDVGCQSKAARAWDIYGAVYCQDPPGFVASAVIDQLEDLAGGEDLFRWNDDPERTHGDVVQLLCRGIAAHEVEDPIGEEPTRPDAIRSVDVARAYEMAWRQA